MIESDKVPAELRAVANWCLWRLADRNGKQTKVPFQTTDYEAESNNPKTWCSFDDALDRHDAGGYAGLGFMFGVAPSGFVGIDLDGCRDPETGRVAEWAKEIITKLSSYAEVSPSKSGIKIFVRGRSPFTSGKNLKLDHLGEAAGKKAGIEIYDHLRYFAVTGLRVKGPHTCEERQAELDWLKGKYWPDAVQTQGGDFYGEDSVLDRARKYLSKCPPAISGQNGSGSAFSVACRLVCGFGLSRETSLLLFREWNQTCQPPWTERELEHKIDDAAKQSGPRNYLRNVNPPKWQSITIPEYAEPKSNGKPKIRKSTLADAINGYIKHIETGGGETVSLGLSNLDRALEGGIEAGELVLIASRPSHGKSMLAMQFMHYWSSRSMPCLFISEEMPTMMLGKRAMQFISKHPQHEWTSAPDSLRSELAEYSRTRSVCHIIESCGSCDVAVEQVEEAIREHGIKAVVIDYAQCLKSKGRDRYEQVTNTSVALREMAHRNKIVTIVLCHLGREIEKRKKFIPVLSDLKDSGQLEQDADVILFLVWPWRLDNKQKPDEYQIFVAKNRNRGIISPVVNCEFNPVRQTVTDVKSENYERGFDSTDDIHYWEPRNEADRFD